MREIDFIGIYLSRSLTFNVRVLATVVSMNRSV